MKKLHHLLRYFSTFEWVLWISSVGCILLFFFLFDKGNPLTLIASLIGATSLIFIAKGNPIGQLLTIVFSVFYGIISFSCAYYGEMITYLGMTAPMALFALIAWLQNPYKGKKSEVKVNRLTPKEYLFAFLLTCIITAAFWFILRFLGTANLIPSTVSVATSFLAVYLTFRRSPYYALAYAANDVVLIVLWILAAAEDISYISVIVNFVIFLFNDIYGFINWRRLHKKQNAGGIFHES